LVPIPFLSAFLRFDASIPVALLFVAAMLCFFLGLLWFLREIYLATKSLRIGAHDCRTVGFTRSVRFLNLRCIFIVAVRKIFNSLFEIRENRNGEDLR
jgi:hypothetical protein